MVTHYIYSHPSSTFGHQHLRRTARYHPYRASNYSRCTANSKYIEWESSGWDRSLCFRTGDFLKERTYCVVDKIGEGTSARVLLCEDVEAQKQVVVKIQRGSEYYYIAREIVVLNTISKAYPATTHPSVPIIRLLDEFEIPADSRSSSSSPSIHKAPKAVALVFEKGDVSLWNHLKSKEHFPWDFALVRRWGRQMLEALQLIHDIDITHADIKPENWVILRDRSAHDFARSDVKLIDFGLAAFPSSRKPLVVGTRAYSAPEIVLQQGWTTPLDIWAIACVFVELLTGKVLFACSDDKEQLALFERTLGRLPAEMIARSSAGKDWFDEEGRINWAGETPHSVMQQKDLKEQLFSVLNNTHHNRRDLHEDDVYAFYDLISSMLEYDPSKRPSAQRCLDHPFFTHCTPRPSSPRP